jgi:hypothetical protein
MKTLRERESPPRGRRKAGTSGDLSAVIEVSGESFRPEDRSELRPNAMDTQHHQRRGRHFGLFCIEQRVPLGLHSLDLFEQELRGKVGDGVNHAADLISATVSFRL